MKVDRLLALNILKPYFVHRPTQLIRRLVRARWRPTKARVALPWGLKIDISPREAIGNSIWQTGVHELSTTEAIFRLLPYGGIGVDVGANIGYMTLAMCAATRDAGQIYSFEPHPVLYERLCNNVRMNYRENEQMSVRLSRHALSNRVGTAQLSVFPVMDNEGTSTLCERNGADRIDVATSTLDLEIESHHVDLLKIDVEGSESLVLEGGQMLLKAGAIRTVIFENHFDNKGLVPEMLRQLGYKIYVVRTTIRGPVLEAFSGDIDRCKYQAMDCVASRDPATLFASFANPGWVCLRRRPM